MKNDCILLVNPPYEVIGVKESVSSVSVTLALATLAALTRARGRKVEVLDLNLSPEWEERFDRAMTRLRPDMVGLTFTTPVAPLAGQLARMARDYGDVTVVGGGPHATAVPEDTIATGAFDAIAIGEAEACFDRMLVEETFEGIEGWFTRGMASACRSPMIDDLDTLPFAAVDLFEVDKYVYPARGARQNPVCLLETCRGCYARCTFCNKNIFGFKLRRKSASRVVDEMEFILDAGYGEIHIADDLFTADMRHAEAVCKEIMRRNLRFPWVPRSGLRVDRVSPRLLEVMAEAGCYHIPFGIESGNQHILDLVKKGITLEQVRDAVSFAKGAGMQTTGYFMIGIPGETRETMEDTLRFATDLELDFVKVGVCVPLPGTPMFDELSRENRIKTHDWGRYTYSTPPWDLIESSDVTPELLRQLDISGVPVMDLANATMVRQVDGRYALA